MASPAVKELVERLVEMAGSQGLFARLLTSSNPPHKPGSEGFLGIYAFLDYIARPVIIHVPPGFQKSQLTFSFALAQWVMNLAFLLLPPFPFRGYLVFSIQTAMFVQSVQMYTHISMVFLPIMIMIGWLNALDIYILHGVPEDHHEFREVNKKNKNPREFTFLEKLNWATGLSLQLRGVNWGWEVKNVRRWEFQKSKKDFILNRAKYAVLSFILMDLANSMGAVVQFEDDLSRFGRTLLGFFHLMSGGFIVQFLYCLCGIIMVGSGLGKVDDWPPLYHYWSECYSMRRYWGKTYHQLFRRPLVTPLHALCDKLGIDRRAFLGRTFVRFAVFAMSGIGHALNSAGSFGQDNGCFYIFMYFFCIIEVEDVLSTVYDNAVGRNSSKREIPRRSIEKIFGYVWTIWWMLFLCRIVTEAMGPQDTWMAAPTENLLEPVWIWALSGTKYLRPKYRLKAA